MLVGLGNPLATEPMPQCPINMEAKVQNPGYGIAPFWQCMLTAEAAAEEKASYGARYKEDAKIGCKKEIPLLLGVGALILVLPGYYKALPLLAYVGLKYNPLMAMNSASNLGCLDSIFGPGY